jgi:hypothetical protein
VSDFPDSLRMSALRTFLQCPKRFELAVLGKERGEPYGERMRVGTAIDRVVRIWATQKSWLPEEPVDPAEGEYLLSEEYDKAGEKGDYAACALLSASLRRSERSSPR